MPTRMIRFVQAALRVLLTIRLSSGQPVEIARAQKVGVKDWLIKTDFDPQEVIVKVRKQLEKMKYD